jgi:hypothetical protein
MISRIVPSIGIPDVVLVPANQRETIGVSSPDQWGPQPVRGGADVPCNPSLLRSHESHFHQPVPLDAKD